MKNTVKFFLGGAVAAALILGVFAFTNKQNENKEYLVVRVEEDADFDKIFIQVCDKNGKVEVKEEKLAKAKGNIFDDKEATHTTRFSILINEFAAKGYKLMSLNSFGSAGYATSVNTTLIFEK